MPMRITRKTGESVEAGLTVLGNSMTAASGGRPPAETLRDIVTLITS